MCDNVRPGGTRGALRAARARGASQPQPRAACSSSARAAPHLATLLVSHSPHPPRFRESRARLSPASHDAPRGNFGRGGRRDGGHPPRGRRPGRGAQVARHVQHEPLDDCAWRSGRGKGGAAWRAQRQGWAGRLFASDGPFSAQVPRHDCAAVNPRVSPAAPRSALTVSAMSRIGKRGARTHRCQPAAAAAPFALQVQPCNSSGYTDPDWAAQWGVIDFDWYVGS